MTSGPDGILRDTGVFDCNGVEIREGDVPRSEVGTHHLVAWDETRRIYTALLLEEMDAQSRRVWAETLGDDPLEPVPLVDTRGGVVAFEIVSRKGQDANGE